MAIISLLSLYTALHSHSQPCVVMTTWLTNVCVDLNSESACVAIFGFISVWAAETEIKLSWDIGRLSLKCGEWSIMWPSHIVKISHMIAACRNPKSNEQSVTWSLCVKKEHCALKKNIAHRKRTLCIRVWIRASRVPDRHINGIVLQKNGRKIG